MIRIIHVASADGSLGREEITLTDDFDEAALDYVASGMALVSDTLHDIDLPGSFPTNSTFIKG